MAPPSKRCSSGSTGASDPKMPTLHATPTLPKCKLFAPEIPPSTTTSTLSSCPLFGEVKIKPLKISDLVVGNFSQNSVNGRVCQKSETRCWDNHNGSGKALSFDIFDSDKEISVTVFNSQLDDVEEKIQVNNIIEIRGFRVKNINSTYQRIHGQSLEIILNKDGDILTCEDNTIPDISFELSDLNKISLQNSGDIIDFVGILYADYGLVIGHGKNGKDFSYRNVALTDNTKLSIKLKIWGETASSFILTEPVPIILRKAKVEIYEGEKYLSVTQHFIVGETFNFNRYSHGRMVPSRTPPLSNMCKNYNEEYVNF